MSVPAVNEILDMDLEDTKEHTEQRWMVLYDEDYDNIILDGGDSVALLLDNNQALEILRLASAIVAALAPKNAPDKPPIQAMTDGLEEAQKEGVE